MCSSKADAEPGSTYWSVVEPFWIPLNETWENDPTKFLKAFAEVPTVAANLYAAHWCQSEVNNGRFYQFFWNTTGILAPEAAAACRDIGLHEWERAIIGAMEFFGPTYPRERSARMSRLEPCKGTDPGPFNDMDELFFSWPPDLWGWEKAADEYAKRA